MTQNKLSHIVDRILLSTKFEAERKKNQQIKKKLKTEKKLGIDFRFDCVTTRDCDSVPIKDQSVPQCSLPAISLRKSPPRF